MMDHWLGIVAYKDYCVLVHAGVSLTHSIPLDIRYDAVWKVDLGNRATTYNGLFHKIRSYLIDHRIDTVVTKAGTLGSEGRGRASMLTAGELRGIILAATFDLCPVKIMNKGVVSKTYGDKTVGEYLKDSLFWQKQITGHLERTSRETAMFLIAARALLAPPKCNSDECPTRRDGVVPSRNEAPHLCFRSRPSYRTGASAMLNTNTRERAANLP